jgi:hypothetical protein
MNVLYGPVAGKDMLKVVREDSPIFIPLGNDVKILLLVGIVVLVSLLLFLRLFLVPFEERKLDG